MKWFDDVLNWFRGGKGRNKPKPTPIPEPIPVPAPVPEPIPEPIPQPPPEPIPVPTPPPPPPPAPAAVASVRVQGPSALYLGESGIVTATVLDSSGTPLSRPVTWTVSPQLTISGRMITAVAEGFATVTAECEGKMGLLVIANRARVTGGYSPLDSPSTTVYVPRPPRTGITMCREFLDTRVDTDFLTGGTSTVLTVTGTGTGSNLQTHLNTAAANPGTKYTIKIPTGVTLNGQFEFPAKAGTSWTYIMSSDMYDGTFGVAEGVRCRPATSGYATVKVTTGGPGVFTTVADNGTASYYRLMGLECYDDTASGTNASIVTFGSGTTALGNLPHHLYVDRCYIHGNPAGTQEIPRGIGWNAKYMACVDSYVSGIRRGGNEAQAIAGWNGLGPSKIVNNYLEATGENFINGGADGGLGVVPADLEFRRNHCRKLLAWLDEGVFGNSVVKNIFEYKNCQYSLVEGNIFENSWSSGQAGEALLFQRVGDADSGAAAIISDHTIRYNRIIRCACIGTLNVSTNGGGRMSIEHTLITDIADPVLVGVVGNDPYPFVVANSGWRLYVTDTTPYIYFDHNTHVLHPSAAIVANEQFLLDDLSVGAIAKFTNFTLTNNILPQSTYGIRTAGTAPAAYETGALDDRTSGGYTAGGNAHAGDEYGVNISGDYYQAAAWTLDGDYRPTSGTLTPTGGTDSTPVGCDITTLLVAISGVAEA